MTLENILQDSAAVRGIAQASRPGIVMDFDGTLSKIAPTPDSAVIEPRSARALRGLVGRFPLVAVLSGRGVHDLADRVGVGGVVYVGNHGVEYIVDGVYRVAGDVDGDAIGIPAILAHLRAALNEPGVLYEDKGFSASVHFRQATDLKSTARILRESLPNAPGIEQFDTFWGKKVLEIRPRRAVDKGDALISLVEEYDLDALVFAGDDTTDVDAMKRMRSMSGVRCIAVAVKSGETTPALLAAASHAVDGVCGVSDLLEMLACLRGDSG